MTFTISFSAQICAVICVLSACLASQVSSSQLESYENFDAADLFGGKLADEKFVCSIAFVNVGGFICTGILSSVDTILTAAHCFYKRDRSQVNVFVGDRVRGTSKPLDISDIYILKGYNGDARHGNDLAVVRLVNEKPEKCVIEPQYWPETNPTDGDKVYVFGYGVINFDRQDTPDLKQGTLQIAEFGKTLHKYYDENCSAQSTTDKKNEIMCAVSPGFPDVNTAGTCVGDSGGPLIKRTEYGYVVVGVNSYSTVLVQCSSPGNVDKFARVYAHADDLESLIYYNDYSAWNVMK